MLAEATVCLALAMYYEARSEGPVAMIAVGQVAINRSTLPRYPQDLCGVIKQGGASKRNRCQFSFYCDGKSETPKDQAAWDMSLELAGAMIAGGVRDLSLLNATCYHARYVTPTWAYKLKPIKTVKGHVFYAC